MAASTKRRKPPLQNEPSIGLKRMCAERVALFKNMNLSVEDFHRKYIEAASVNLPLMTKKEVQTLVEREGGYYFDDAAPIPSN